MKKNILIAILLFSLVFGTFGVETNAAAFPPDNNVYEIYVSPAGNDANSGTISDPLQTVEQALNKVDVLKNDYPNRSFDIVFRGGTYRITSTISLKNKLSGNKRLTLKAYPNETVVFSGAREIDASAIQPLTDSAVISKIRNYSNGNVYAVNLSNVGISASDIGELHYAGAYSDNNSAIPEVDMNREFYVNDARMMPARYPNSGYITGYTVVDEGGDNDTDGPEISYNFGFNAATKWASAPYKRVFAALKYDWAAYSLDIASVTGNSSRTYLTMEEAAPFGVNTDGRFYVYNLVEELDAAHEYYYDKDTNKLYFYSSTTPQKCELTVASTMFTINGQSNISFEGITFEKMQGGPIYANGSDSIDINNCVIRYCSSDGGVVYFDKCKNSGVRNSEIYDVSAGIALGRPSSADIQALTPTGNYVVNNEIHDFARIDHGYEPALLVNGVGDLIANNKIYNSEHQAVSLGGYGNTIEYNEFYNTDSDTSDAGCIYAGQNFARRGNVIRYNYFHDINDGRQKPNIAIYLDDYFSGTQVIGNIFENVDRTIVVNRGYDNTIVDNVFVNANKGVRLLCEPENALSHISAGGDIYEKSTIYDTPAWRSAFPELFDGTVSDPNLMKWAHGNTVQNNYVFNTEGDEFGDSSTYNTLLQKNTLADSTSVRLDQYQGSTYKEKAITLVNQQTGDQIDEIGLLSSAYTIASDQGDDVFFEAYNDHVHVWGNTESRQVTIMLVAKTAGSNPSQADIAYFTEVITDKDGNYEVSLPYDSNSIDISQYEVRVNTGKVAEIEEVSSSASMNDLIDIDITMLDNVTWASVFAEITNHYHVDLSAAGIRVYAAIYDGNQMVASKVCDLSDTDISEQLPIPAGADHMKCFVWDMNQSPLTDEAESKTITPIAEGETRFAINCWGDSLTYGAGGNGNSYPSYLLEIMGSGNKVRNFGIGGEDTRTIAGRMGAVPFVLSDDIEIPADPTAVPIAVLEGAPLKQSGVHGINYCYIGGVKGSLGRDGSGLTFTRKDAGDAVSVEKGARITTDASRYVLDEINVIMTGANDVAMLQRGVVGGSLNILGYQKQMVSAVESEHGQYLIVGVADGEIGNYLDELKYLEKRQEAVFGKYYLNLRKVLTDPAIYAEVGFELSAADLADMDAGCVPGSIICNDGVHFNADGYQVVARAIYNKLVSLGIVVGQNN